jgi:hypothetical protein
MLPIVPASCANLGFTSPEKRPHVKQRSAASILSRAYYIVRAGKSFYFSDMATRSIVLSAAVRCALLAAVIGPGSAAAFELIKETESALPADQVRARGISRGPTLVIESPRPDAGMLTSPVKLKIKFDAHGGAAIDPDSVLLTYAKKPAIDLTERVRPYISASGIDAQGAEAPPGTHRIIVEVSDTRGHSSSVELTFSISK